MQLETTGAKTKRNMMKSIYRAVFIWTGSRDSPWPQCMICKEVLANESMCFKDRVVKEFFWRDPMWKHSHRNI